MHVPLRVVVASFALAGAAPAELGAGADADSAKAALEREIGTLLEEIDRPPATDLFEDGRRPELVVLSSQSVMGETTPCG
ncbi:MAG: hypothetical protein ACT4PE_07705 [Candidatus Eiseniibacteriota bacterium]